MNDSRERFEAHCAQKGLMPRLNGTLFEAWQAAEQQALERAAEMCVALSNGYVSDVNPDRSRTAAAAATMCARQIQRLIEQSASKEKQG